MQPYYAPYWSYMSAGKVMQLQAPRRCTERPCKDAGSCHEEESRPELVGILRQQGIHPHPGPEWHRMTSILEDDCWHQWGWPQLEECGGVISDNVAPQQDNVSAQQITVLEDDSDDAAEL